MSDKTTYQGKWLNFKETSFVNSEGKQRTWEYASRSNAETGVAAIAIHETPEPHIILVKQYRHPVGSQVIEFPAGLSETGEAHEITALRELEEETGYTGDVIGKGPPIYSSPGLTDESVALITIRVTAIGTPTPTPDEDIEVLSVPLAKLTQKLREQESTGCFIDAKLWSFALGLSWNQQA